MKEKISKVLQELSAIKINHITYRMRLSKVEVDFELWIDSNKHHPNSCELAIYLNELLNQSLLTKINSNDIALSILDLLRDTQVLAQDGSLIIDVTNIPPIDYL